MTASSLWLTRGDLVTETDVGAGQLAQLLFEKLHQLPLLALHAIRMVGVAGEQRQIERRHWPGFAVAELPGRSLQSDIDHARNDVELVEQIERRRVECRAAQFHDELRLRRQQHRRDTAAEESQRGGEPDRPGADDNDAIFFIRH